MKIKILKILNNMKIKILLEKRSSEERSLEKAVGARVWSPYCIFLFRKSDMAFILIFIKSYLGRSGLGFDPDPLYCA